LVCVPKESQSPKRISFSSKLCLLRLVGLEILKLDFHQFLGGLLVWIENVDWQETLPHPQLGIQPWPSRLLQVLQLFYRFSDSINSNFRFSGASKYAQLNFACRD
jgi:hypothetical protein